MNCKFLKLLFSTFSFRKNAPEIAEEHRILVKENASGELLERWSVIIII